MEKEAVKKEDVKKEVTVKKEPKLEKIKTPTQVYVATGRRKNAVASVRLTLGKGKITVNKKLYTEYFCTEVQRIIVKQPFAQTDSMDKFDVAARIRGGGPSGQAGALRLGISRALVMVDSAHISTLRKNGFLTRDPRAKERKKYGQKGARKQFQWTKR